MEKLQSFFLEQSIFDIEELSLQDNENEDECNLLLNNLFFFIQFRPFLSSTILRMIINLSKKSNLFLKCFEFFLEIHQTNKIILSPKSRQTFIFKFIHFLINFLFPEEGLKLSDQNKTNSSITYSNDLPLKAYISPSDILSKLFSMSEEEINAIFIPKDSLTLAILNDQVNVLQELSSENSSSFLNERIEEKDMSWNYFAQYHPPLIHFAAFCQSIKCFKFLLLNGADLALEDLQQFSVFQYAVAGGNSEIIRLLEQHLPNYNYLRSVHIAAQCYQSLLLQWIVNNKIKPDQKDELNTILLNGAVSSNNISLLQEIIQKGVDPNQKYDDISPLVRSASVSSIDCLRLLLSLPNIDVSQKNSRGDSILHEAITYCQYESIKVLMKDGRFNINIKNKRGLSPLLSSIPFAKPQFITFLLNQPNININIQNQYGSTALHFAVRYDRLNLLKILLLIDEINPNIADVGGMTPLHEAAITSTNSEIIKALLDNPKVDPNIPDESQMTPFHSSIRLKLFENASIFLSSDKINVNSRCQVTLANSDSVSTPLLEAMKISSSFTATLLQSKKIDPNFSSTNGIPPICYAVEDILSSQNTQILELLLNTDNINPITIKQCLFLAAKKSINKAIITFFDHKVDINMIDDFSEEDSKESLLHIFVTKSNIEMIEEFKKRRGNPNIRNKNGRTPLHFAAFSSYEIFEAICSFPNLEINLQDQDGKTPLYLAAESGQTNHVHLLLSKKKCES